MMKQQGQSRNKKMIAHVLIVLMIVTTLLPWQSVPAAAAAKPDAPVLKTVIDNGTSVTASWYTVQGCSGYQVQYADNRLFLGKISRTLAGAGKSTETVKVGVDSGRYYVRVRAYTKKGGGTAYSDWTLSGNARTTKSVAKKLIRKNRLKKLELRRAAKQKVPGFDTVQGACYAKGYVYYLLENRNVSYSRGRCKIVKMKLSKKKVVRVSAPLKLSHGNDITFDTKRNRIVVAHSTPNPKQISVVDPKTLKVTQTLVSGSRSMPPMWFRWPSSRPVISGPPVAPREKTPPPGREISMDPSRIPRTTAREKADTPSGSRRWYRFRSPV